jgi:hypothetical protein
MILISNFSKTWVKIFAHAQNSSILQAIFCTLRFSSIFYTIPKIEKIQAFAKEAMALADGLKANVQTTIIKVLR